MSQRLLCRRRPGGRVQRHHRFGQLRERLQGERVGGDDLCEIFHLAKEPFNLLMLRRPQSGQPIEARGSQGIRGKPRCCQARCEDARDREARDGDDQLVADTHRGFAGRQEVTAGTITTPVCSASLHESDLAP